ncbi:GTP cyclohydrolase 1 1 domain protein [Burkholderia pseudomallei]|nr:GTP cyclohydrolase 1 1 domain protein [Burkholderia pseudomallei]
MNAHANDGAVGDHRSEAGTPVAPPSAIRFVADLANRRDRACARRSHRDAANRATGLIDAQRAARSFAGESNVWTPCGRHRRNRFGSGAFDLSAAFGRQVDGDRFIRSIALIDRRCHARDCNDVRARASIAAVRKVEKPRRQPVYIGRRAAGALPGRAGAWTRGEHVDDVSMYRCIGVSMYRRFGALMYRRGTSRLRPRRTPGAGECPARSPWACRRNCGCFKGNANASNGKRARVRRARSTACGNPAHGPVRSRRIRGGGSRAARGERHRDRQRAHRPHCAACARALAAAFARRLRSRSGSGAGRGLRRSARGHGDRPQHRRARRVPASFAAVSRRRPCGVSAGRALARLRTHRAHDRRDQPSLYVSGVDHAPDRDGARDAWSGARRGVPDRGRAAVPVDGREPARRRACDHAVLRRRIRARRSGPQRVSSRHPPLGDAGGAPRPAFAGCGRGPADAARVLRHSRAAACVACGPPPAFAAEAQARLGEAPNGRSERRGSRAKSAARCAPCAACCVLRAARCAMRDARRVKRAASLAASCPSERDRFVVERRVRDAVRDRRIVDVAAQHPPAPILRQEPQTIARRRPVRRAVGVKADRRGRLRERPGAVIAEQPRRDLFDGHADRVRLREPSGRLHPMRRIVEPRARVEQRAHEQSRGIRVQRDEFAPACERLLRMIAPHFARRRDRPARAARLGDRIPRLAHAQPVEFARRERADHLRRRNHDAADIVQRIDAVRREPVIQPHRVRAGRERLREHGAPAECRERGLQLARRAVRVGEPVRERDRLAVAVQHHRHRQVGARPADAELHAVDEPVQRVRGVELARQQLVANARPRRLPAELERQAVACAELEPLRGDERRGVAQRDEADAQAGAFRHIGGRCFDARCVHAFCTFVQDCECAASSRRAASTIRMP